ncbi:MAG: metalloregulator ArsR/SmtB family transcription factor [Patescibacteria group bacterium]
MTSTTLQLNSIFSALADPTRRDILKRVGKKELPVGEVAKPYKLTLAAISKHLKVLEEAKLILKRRQGKQQLVHASPAAIRDASAFLKLYEAEWTDRFDRLEAYLIKNK